MVQLSFRVTLRDGMYCNLVTIVPKLLGVLIVIVLVTYEERASYGTTVGVLEVWWKQSFAV